MSFDGASGFEVPTFDHDALAEALSRMLGATADERRDMGARGRAHVAATFSVERILEETVRLYDDLLVNSHHTCSEVFRIANRIAVMNAQVTRIGGDPVTVQ